MNITLKAEVLEQSSASRNELTDLTDCHKSY